MTTEQVIILPIRTYSEANLRRHWAAKARRTKAQRGATYLLVKPHVCKSMLPAEITLTRIAPRQLDPDNLARSMKAIQDGVADAFGVDDGSPDFTWRYEQRRGGVREYAVEVRGTMRKRDLKGLKERKWTTLKS